MSELGRNLLASKLEADCCVSLVLPLILGILRVTMFLFKVWCSITVMFP